MNQHSLSIESILNNYRNYNAIEVNKTALSKRIEEMDNITSDVAITSEVVTFYKRHLPNLQQLEFFRLMSHLTGIALKDYILGLPQEEIDLSMLTKDELDQINGIKLELPSENIDGDLEIPLDEIEEIPLNADTFVSMQEEIDSSLANLDIDPDNPPDEIEVTFKALGGKTFVYRIKDIKQPEETNIMNLDPTQQPIQELEPESLFIEELQEQPSHQYHNNLTTTPSQPIELQYHPTPQPTSQPQYQPQQELQEELSGQFNIEELQEETSEELTFGESEEQPQEILHEETLEELTIDEIEEQSEESPQEETLEELTIDEIHEKPEEQPQEETLEEFNVDQPQEQPEELVFDSLEDEPTEPKVEIVKEEIDNIMKNINNFCDTIKEEIDNSFNGDITKLDINKQCPNISGYSGQVYKLKGDN